MVNLQGKPMATPELRVIPGGGNLQSGAPSLRGSGGGGILGPMDNARLDRMDNDLRDLRGEMREVRRDVSGLRLWLVGTAVATIGALAALQIGLWTYSANVSSTALSAIQTVLAAKPSPPPPPTVIVIPRQEPAVASGRDEPNAPPKE